MLKMYNSNTKNFILENSIRLFAHWGYPRVSMRQIASESNIEAASIYNHFKNKEHILDSVFDYFSRMNKRNNHKEVEEMIKSDVNPKIILSNLFFTFPEEEYFLCICCIRIFFMEQYVNDKAKRFLIDFFYGDAREDIRYTLTTLVNIGKIKPFNIDFFVELWARSLFYFSFNATHTLFDEEAKNTYSKQFTDMNNYLINLCTDNIL